MEHKIKIAIDLTDKGLYSMPQNVSFICKLVDKAFWDQPVCVDRISIEWVNGD